ncbi:hypothetical protein N7G274_007399 [Stereocaulon virgatum]|uniref:Uncharacterized protein n=1 Tax=Stereocaulon virgatum TaxID=373712 RepID=A0ABR4A500_9LECA
MASLPLYLLNAWRLKYEDLQQALDEEQLNEWTTSSLAEIYLKFQLEKHQTASNERAAADRPPSLFATVVGRILDDVKLHDDLATRLETIAEDLWSATFRTFPDEEMAENGVSMILQKFLNDPRTPYRVLRQFAALPEFSTQEGQTLVDIDEVVLRNEHYIRSQRNNGQDCECLITLDEFCSILSESPQDGTPVIVRRQDPPKGGLEVLDELRKREVSMQPSSAAFSQTFDRITRGILHGLDWNNVLIAGGIALTTLLHTDPSQDDDKSVKDPDINLYIYGLGPKDANHKLGHIYDTWVGNLPSTADQRLVVKTSKTITFLTCYPNRRVQITLKLLHSPTDILLGFDLDPCAIGYDGSKVLMLPRCARAIETGYSLFTMDLVWGHHIGGRRATQIRRVFKYADRGFGIRFLPSYARSLEDDKLKSLVFQEASTPDLSEDTRDRIAKGTRRVRRLNRKPYGKEHGLKTLKRIAYLGRDFVNRVCFGCSQLAISPKQYQRQIRTLDDPQSLINSEALNQGEHDGERVWNEMYRKALDDDIAKRLHKTIDKIRNVPRIHSKVLDTTELHAGLPDGQKGLGSLETFMRHCEAWRLHVRNEAILICDDVLEGDDDPHKYEDLHTFTWDTTFDVRQIANRIEGENHDLWTHLKVAICCKLGVPFSPSGWQGYSTRRIRSSVFGDSLAKVLGKQITIPVIVPWILENYFWLLFEDHAVPVHITNVGPLIPIHNASAHNSTRLPSLQDTSDESGNLRYWVITNESMWDHQDPLLHEFSELMWSMVHRFHQAMENKASRATGSNTDSQESLWRLAQNLRRHIVLPEEFPDDQVSTEATRHNHLPTRECLLFKHWALRNTVIPERRQISRRGESIYFHRLFRDEYFEYPFDDSLFWEEGDEGEWGREGTPAWVNVP